MAIGHVLFTSTGHVLFTSIGHVVSGEVSQPSSSCQQNSCRDPRYFQFSFRSVGQADCQKVVNSNVHYLLGLTWIHPGSASVQCYVCWSSNVLTSVAS